MDDAWGSDTFGSSSSNADKQSADFLDEPAGATKAAKQEKVLRPKVNSTIIMHT